MSTEEKQLKNILSTLKVGLPVLTTILIGLFSLTWSMNSRLAVVENEIQSLREEVRNQKATMVPRGEYELFRGEISRRVAVIEGRNEN